MLAVVLADHGLGAVTPLRLIGVVGVMNPHGPSPRQVLKFREDEYEKECDETSDTSPEVRCD
jgi:hypothetical protein